MKKIIVLSIVLMFLTTGILSSAENISINKEDDCNEVFDEKNYYAVIIGITEFIGNPKPEENIFEKGIIAFYEKLLNCSNWQQENILFLQNKNATKEKIHDSITIWLNDKENEDDIVLIYVLTHGYKIGPLDIKNRKYGHAFINTYNSTNWIVYDKETKISDKELNNWLNELDSKHIAVILEHCYSGRMFALNKPGRTILTAGGLILACPVDWSTYFNDGIFGFFLKQGLDGVADLNNDGWVTVWEAYHYLRPPVIWYSTWYHLPKLKPQIPFLYDHHKGNIPLIKNDDTTQTNNV